MAAAAQQGAPVPAVIAIDSEGRALDRACFLLEYVDGRSVPDTAPGYHAHGWLREAVQQNNGRSGNHSTMLSLLSTRST